MKKSKSKSRTPAASRKVRSSGTSRRPSGRPKTQLEKLRAAVDLDIAGPVGLLLEGVCRAEEMRARKKGRVQ